MAQGSGPRSKTSSYLLIIMDWKDTGSHWIKGFSTLEEARDAASEKSAAHEEIMDRILIVKGEIVQIGIDDGHEVV